LYQNLTVLCVEDEEGVRRPVVNTLRYYFGKVFEASNGKDGLDIYFEHKPDLILCDIQMPIMNGIDMIKNIRQNDSLVPVILLTAYNNEEYLIELINLHVQHFILKPINSKKLEEGIKNALHGNLVGRVKLCKDAVLDIDSLALHVDGKKLSLSVREVKFLSLLSTNRVIFYTQIEQELWAQKEMSSGALKSFVRDLRKKLPFEMIENIAQTGYKLLHI